MKESNFDLKLHPNHFKLLGSIKSPPQTIILEETYIFVVFDFKKNEKIKKKMFLIVSF